MEKPTIIADHDLTPKRIVDELERYIVGQHKAKRAVAIAIRNRWRRQQVESDLRNEIHPKNIIMIGPTGVGKTEIARRLARLVRAPFVKVEASKFTEVGYVGRDVESMIRDLTELAVQLVRREAQDKVHKQARKQAEDQILDRLFPPQAADASDTSGASDAGRPAYEQPPPANQIVFTVDPSGAVCQTPPTIIKEAGKTNDRDELRQRLRDGEFDQRTMPVEVQETSMPMMQVFSNAGLEEMGINLQEMFENSPMGRRPPKKREVKVTDALQILIEQESQRLIDKESVTREALQRVEQSGIVFIDEIDKIASRESSRHGSGPDISREGVQRDILPIVEGSTVTTKYGMVHTDHILFIAAGAFHVANVSDLIPELQGRFPIRVELDSLSEKDFLRILTEPDNSLVRQYRALLATEQVTLDFTDDALKDISRLAAQVNNQAENIGARRLYTVMERLLDELSFAAPDRAGSTIMVDPAYVAEHLQNIVEDQDLSRYIL